MATLLLKNGSKAFHEGQECTIISLKNFSEVRIKYDDTKVISTANIMNLSTTAPEKKENKYLDAYTDKEWDSAKKRYNIIETLIFKHKTVSDVSKLAEANGVSNATIYNWIKLYEQTSEISSLISNNAKRGKRGSRLDSNLEDIIQAVLDDLYLNKQRYSFGKIYQYIVKECKILDIKRPHENTIRNRIKSINPELATKKRFGHKAAQEKYNNYDGTYPEGDYPFDVIQIDHTPLDIIIVDELHRQPLPRPHLTLAIDVYSRMITGFYLSLQAPGYYNVSQCMFNMLSNKESFLKEQEVEGEWNIFGVPRIIHVDNGADLVSSDMQRVCDELSITLLKRPVARPQFGPHVERVLGTINKEVHNLPGTTFSNIQEKGTYNSQKEASLTLKELTQWLTHYIVNIYHKKPHHGLLGMTPSKKYEIGIFGDDDTAGTGMLPPIVDSLDNIKIALLPTYFRTVQKDGISIEGIKYYSDVLRHWIGITDDNNKKIKHKIKFDPLNIQKIYFFDSELEEYFDIPYRKISAPVMTLWDLYAVKRYLKDKNITDYDEDDIFQAYEVLESIAEKSINTHKKHKLGKSRSPRISTMNKTASEKEEDDNLNIENLDSLFENITIYEVNEKEDDEK